MEEIYKILKSGTDKDKLSLFYFDCSMSNEKILMKFDLWGRYHFPQYYKSEDAPFHTEINTNNLLAYKGLIDQFVDIAFKGAGKDVKTKLFIAFAMLNDTEHFRRFYKVNAEDGGNSKQIVTDIYNMLVNPKVQVLYPKTFGGTNFKREETMGSFTTNSGIKIVADTVYTSQRGDVQEEARPDFIWFNDFETMKTLRSAVVGRSIWDNMEEARTGLEKGGACIYTVNYISESGNVHRLVTEKLNDKKIVLIVPIMVNGKPTWDRYSIADIEAMKATDDNFEGERMCNPSASKYVMFNRQRLDNMPRLKQVRESGKLKIFKEYNPAHRIAGGHDIGGGVGLDSSTSVFIDFDIFPAQVVATYAYNEIKPDAFGHEMARQGQIFGECLLAPENNKFDEAIGILKLVYPEHKIYMTEGKASKITFSAPTTYGFNSNQLTVPTIMNELVTAVDDGILELNDEALIIEARSYTTNDIMDREVDPRLTTRHFDLLRAAAIAWYIRKHAKAGSARKPINAIDKLFINRPRTGGAESWE